jgi:hypothetical protein
MSNGPEQPGIEPAPQPVAPPPEKANPFGRLLGVLFSPDETFASIARRPDWLVPLLLFVVISAVSGFVFAHHVDFISAARTQMEAQGKLSHEQIDQALKIPAAIATVAAYCAPIFSVIFFVAVAAILMLAYRMLGGEGEFRQYFSVTLYAWMPRFLQSMILTGILAFRAEPIGAELLPTLVRSNLGFLADPKTQAVLFSLLTSLDVFTIWGLVLMAIGFAHVSRFSKTKSAGIVVSLWAFVTVIKVGFAALGALMRARK